MNFRDEIKALELAMPIALATRFEDGFEHCLEASACGAAVLRARGFEASVLPCAIFGGSESLDVNISVGMNEKEVYECIAEADDTDLPTFDEWRSKVSKLTSSPAEKTPVHAVVEARFNGERAVIDLTLGQLRKFGVNTPLTWASFGEGWTELVGKDWRLFYLASTRAEEVHRITAKLKLRGFIEDVQCLSELALMCELDAAKFWINLKKLEPTFKTIESRLNSFCRVSNIQRQAEKAVILTEKP